MTIIYLAIVWCVGIWIAVRTGGANSLWVTAMLAATVVALLSRNRRFVATTALCLVIFCAGGYRARLASTHINVDQIAYYGNDAEVTLTGLVDDPPRVRDTRLDVTMAVELLHGAGRAAQPMQGRILLHAPRYPELQYGQRLRVTGTLEEVRNWSDFDYREYLARQGIHRLLRDAQIIRLETSAGNPVRQAIYEVRARAQAVVAALIPAPQDALLSGILLGDDSRMSPSMRDDFRTTGMSHIIAISGFNIAILAGAMLRGGRLLLGWRASAWVALAGVALYTVFVGADAAVVRAAIMGSLYIISNRILGRPTFAPAGLFVAAWLMSLANPFVLWDAGFQLSFAATLGLMLFVEPVSERIQPWLAHHLPGERVSRLMPLFTDTVIVTFAAQLMSAPLLAYHFGQISLASLPANLLVLPVQPGVMFWGALATLAGLVSPLLGQPLAWVAWLFLSYTTTLVEALAQLPFAVVDLQPGTGSVLAFYALLVTITWLARQPQDKRQSLLAQARGRAAQGVPVLLALSLVLTLAWSRTQPDGNLHIAFLDVGQGDAIFIQTPSGRQVLVDGGRFPSVLRASLGRQMPFWDRTLDLVVATHPDDDHVAGLPEVFNRHDVDLLLTNGAQEGASRAYDALLQEAGEDGAEVQTALVGQRLALDDDVHLTVLHPGATPLASDNENSVSLHLTYGAFSLLLTGDAELEAERAMAASGLPLRALVFKAGHHGSRGSSNAFFLDQVQPQIVVISAGANNDYGHPHQEVLERAAAIGANILRTDELGTIEVVTDGERMWWEAER